MWSAAAQAQHGTNGYFELPVLPMAGQVNRLPVARTLASLNNHDYLHAPAAQTQQLLSMQLLQVFMQLVLSHQKITIAFSCMYISVLDAIDWMRLES